MNIEISEQIKLSPLLETDAVEILNLVNSSRVNLEQFLYWVKDVKCIDSTNKYILERINSGLNGSSWFKIYFKGNISGVFAIKSVCPESFVAELGYWLSSATQGNGIIKQIIQKLPGMLSNTGTTTIEFRCLEQNYASINIALKSGATLVESIPNFMIANEVKQNLNIYWMQL